MSSRPGHGWQLLCSKSWKSLRRGSLSFFWELLLARAPGSSPGWWRCCLCLPCCESLLPPPLPQQSGWPLPLPGRQCPWQRFSACVWFPTRQLKRSSSQNAWKSLPAFSCLQKTSWLPEGGWPHLSRHLISSELALVFSEPKRKHGWWYEINGITPVYVETDPLTSSS